MANFNKIILIGNLTADPEMRFTVEGSAITKYRLAVNRPKRSDGTDSGVDFVPVVSFGRLAEISGEYLKKGKQVLVEGRIQVKSYSTAEGKTKWSTEVVASSMTILDKSDRKQTTEEEFPAEPDKSSDNNDNDDTFDDIPF